MKLTFVEMRTSSENVKLYDDKTGVCTRSRSWLEKSGNLGTRFLVLSWPKLGKKIRIKKVVQNIRKVIQKYRKARGNV